MRDDELVTMLSRHTAPTPPIHFAEAVAVLEAFGEQVTPLLAFEQKRRVTPEIELAALAFLTYLFTPLRPELESDYRAAFEAAGLVMRHASDETHQRFLEEVVLNCTAPDDVRRFSGMIRHTMPTERVGQTLRHYAAIGNDLHLCNSFWLLHYMHASDEVVLAIAAQLIGRPTTNPYVREAATATLRFAAGTNVTGT